MLKRKAINLLAILTALAMCLCVMIPTEASAAPVDYSSIPSSELPASLGGDLHGRKTESIDIEGKGTLQATVDYDNGTFQIIDFDGTVQEIPPSASSRANGEAVGGDERGATARNGQSCRHAATLTLFEQHPMQSRHRCG